MCTNITFFLISSHLRLFVIVHSTSVVLLLLEALQLQRSFGLLNEFLPFDPVSDAVLPVCYFHPCYIAHPPIYFQIFLMILLVQVTTHILFFTMPLSGIRYTCPNQAKLCALMQFMMFLSPVSLFSSSFTFTLL